MQKICPFCLGTGHEPKIDVSFDSGFWSLDLGIWILISVFGSWSLDLGSFFLDFGAWILEFGSSSLDVGSCFFFLILEFGSWFFFFFWILELGFWILVKHVGGLLGERGVLNGFPLVM